MSEQKITAYKGMGMDFRCRDFQYAVGQTYTHDGDVVRCAAGGFHACEAPFDVWNYYPLGTSRFAEVEVGGKIDRAENEDSKIASAQITIRAELTLPEFIKRGVAWIVQAAKGNTATDYKGHATATGDSGHAAATGDKGHAAATGDSGHAAATGYKGHAAATGYSGHAAATGDRGHAAATGKWGHAAATGYSGHAAATGKWGIAAALGPNATAKAGADGWLVLAHWAWTDSGYELRQVRSAKVGTEGIEAGIAYRLDEAGAFIRVEAV